MVGERLYRRAVLASTGALIGTETTLGTASAQRPTISVSSGECESITVDYVDDGPPADVTIVGDGTAETLSINPGETKQVDVEPGTYQVSARPTGAVPERAPAIVVTGSPVTVERCEPKAALSARAECLPDSDYDSTIYFENTYNGCVLLKAAKYDILTGDYLRSGSSVIEPGETHRGRVSSSNYYAFHYVAHLGDPPDSSGQCDVSNLDEQIPINGKQMLVVAGPCNDLLNNELTATVDCASESSGTVTFTSTFERCITVRWWRYTDDQYTGDRGTIVVAPGSSESLPIEFADPADEYRFIAAVGAAPTNGECSVGGNSPRVLIDDKEQLIIQSSVCGG